MIVVVVHPHVHILFHIGISILAISKVDHEHQRLFDSCDLRFGQRAESGSLKASSNSTFSFNTFFKFNCAKLLSRGFGVLGFWGFGGV